MPAVPANTTTPRRAINNRQLRPLINLRYVALDLDVTVQFADGEEVTTETSAKFRPGGVRGWLEATGYDAATRERLASTA